MNDKPRKRLNRAAFDWHKLAFVLPNAFTVSSIFCGFYAITLCLGNPSEAQLYTASIAILFAMLFDGVDGRVARLTKTQSDFGVELDSLADVMSFGVAPAVLVYKWGLEPLGFAGTFVCFAFAACGALRLARFNVMAHRKVPGSSKFFTGLPIPLGAGMLVAVIIAHHHARPGEVPAALPLAALVVALSLLMVSSIKYRTFKDARPSRRTATLVFGMLLVGVGVATKVEPAFVPVVYFAAYLALGIVEEIVFFKKRRREKREARLAAEAAVAAEAEEHH